MPEENTQQEQKGGEAQESAVKPDVASAPSAPKKEKTTRGMTNLILEQIRSLIEINVALNSKVKDLSAKLESSEKNVKLMEEKVLGYDERISKIETNMEKFIGLYEMVTNKYNPFLLDEEQSKYSQVTTGDVFEGVDVEKQKQDAKEILNKMKAKQGVSEDGTVKDEVAESLEKAQSIVPDMKFPEENSGEEVKKADLDNFGKTKASEGNIDTEEVVKKELEGLSSQYHFILKDGTPIQSLPELAAILSEMDDEMFTHHVDETKNDFYEWIKHSMDPEFAETIKDEKTRNGLKEKIAKHIQEVQDSKAKEAKSKKENS